MAEKKASITHQLQAAKHKSGKSYGQLAKETGLTNVYVAQLLRRQAQLKPETAPKLQAALPGLPQELIQEMMIPPLRSYDPNLIQDPTIYSAVLHGEALENSKNDEINEIKKLLKGSTKFISFVGRLNEAVMHFGESIKEIVNEEFGDGIMSAIDFYCSVDKVKGVDGKDRVVLTFDGKYLPHSEQKLEHMVSRLRLE